MNLVGTSSRTPGKHSALDKYLGKTAGVISRTFRKNRVTFIDCTAGDGQAHDFDYHTSPGILIRHAEWLRKQGVSVDVLLYERAPRNAAMLRERVAGRAEVFSESSASMGAMGWGRNDIVFVSNDPNTIADWALPPALRYAPKLTTVFSTLGCNVGGLKRLPKDDRQVWFSHIEDQGKLLRSWHDMMLCRLVGDASQWAYLINAPDKWRDQVAEAFSSSFSKIGYETDNCWYKNNRTAFDDAVDRLFLTKAEYQEKKHGKSTDD